jgi:hypothetical protein
MKQVPFLLLCMLLQLLAGIIEALNAASGADTTFFYQAYLLEREHVTDPDYCGIAPECHIKKEKMVCSFADFVDYISTEDARERNAKNLDLFTEIFDNAGDTPLVETSRKLQEAGLISVQSAAFAGPSNVLTSGLPLNR